LHHKLHIFVKFFLQLNTDLYTLHKSCLLMIPTELTHWKEDLTRPQDEEQQQTM